jgi:DNA-binding transcriptional ArsR family regulator
VISPTKLRGLGSSVDRAPYMSGMPRPARTQSGAVGNLAAVAIYYTIWCNNKMDQLANVLTALSHPTRRAIISQLARGPARFLDIAKPFDTALNAVTKHLKMLERAGLIERRKQGREVFITFRGEPLREVVGWMHQYERFWNERLDQFDQYFRNKRKKEKQQ